MEEREKANVAFSIMRNDACLFDYFGISVDWKYGALTTTWKLPIVQGLDR